MAMILGINSNVFPNPSSWAWHFRQVFIRAVEALRKGAFEKVVPAFANIAQEADDLANAEYEQLGSMPADDDLIFDMSDVADWATNAGIDYYQTMTDVRQGILNVLVIGLHHLFEQQQRFFLEREAAPERGRTLGMEKRLQSYGVYPATFSCAAKLHELRVAANALKHGSAEANKDLVAVRPDLFINPDLKRIHGEKDLTSTAETLSQWASAPMAGDHIYVSERDLSEWCDAVVGYWETLAVILDKQQGRWWP